MNNIPRRLLLLALAGLATTLSAASPEYLIGGTVATAAPYARSGESVASDGTDFFAAWSDHRFANARGIVGARITRDGRILDPHGIYLGPAQYIGRPHTVWDGSAYLVVWTASVAAAGEQEEGSHIFAARVDREGRVVLPARIVARGDSYSGAVATNGNVSVIAYHENHDSVPPYQARIAVLDREGNRVHGEALPLSNDGQPGQLVAAGTPSRFVVAWSTAGAGDPPASESSAVTLTSAGRVSGTPRMLGPGWVAGIGTDGASFLVLSAVTNSVFRTTLYARLVNSGLSVLNEASIAQGFNMDAGNVLWRNGRYEVFVTRNEEQFSARETVSIEIGANGAALGSRTRDSATRAAGTNGSDLAVVTFGQHPNATWSQLFAAVYRGSATAAEAQELLSRSGNPHKKPVIAASPHGALVAWDEEEDGSYYTRVGNDGTSLDGRGVRIGSASEGIRVAFDGTNYVAAWKEEAGFGVRRIDAVTGETIAEVHAPVGWIYQLAVAASPEATYVVESASGVRVTRIPHSTNIPDPVPLELIPESEPYGSTVGVGWNGSELLVAWNQGDGFRGSPPILMRGGVRAARVTAGLTLLDPVALYVADYGMGTFYEEFVPPAVASNGNDWLVLTDRDLGEIFARRVRRDGTVPGELEKVANGTGAAAAWDGARYVVAWNDLGTARVMTLSAAGSLTPVRQLPVAENVTGALAIAIRNGETAIAYTKLSFLPEHGGVERTFLRFVAPGATRGRVVRR